MKTILLPNHHHHNLKLIIPSMSSLSFEIVVPSSFFSIWFDCREDGKYYCKKCPTKRAGYVDNYGHGNLKSHLFGQHKDEWKEYCL